MRHASRFILFLIVSSALPLYAQSSVPELNEAGWKALQAGNSRRALTLFNEAFSARPPHCSKKGLSKCPSRGVL